MERSGNNILYVAYPLLTVSDASCGGAEQVLVTLEREMSGRGHRTTVAASEGSKVVGELLSTGSQLVAPDTFEHRAAQHSARVLEHAAREKFSLVHDHSGSFWKHAAELNAPVLATLHLPRTFYPEDMFHFVAPNVYFNCVSTSQVESFRDLPRILGVVENGIAVEHFPLTHKKGNYLLWLGRICPEKAPHLAIDVAKQAGKKLIIAGQVYPFSYHQQYFEREVRPYLESAGGDVAFVELPSFREKIELLRCATSLLITSLAEETSSLVALEAQACGTPVAAFQRGALPEVVAHGRTGFIVETTEEMAAAVQEAEHISPEECRAFVEARFSVRSMADKYELLYRQGDGPELSAG